MIGPTVTLALIQLCFREPVLQLRLIELGVSPNLAGLFFALDLVGYISTSFILGRYKQEEKDFKFIVWLSSFLAIFPSPISPLARAENRPVFRSQMVALGLGSRPLTD